MWWVTKDGIVTVRTIGNNLCVGLRFGVLIGAANLGFLCVSQFLFNISSLEL